MKKKYVISQMIILALLMVSCQLEVPTREMIKAKKLINRAVEVKAEKYDKENLEKAKNSLYVCHDYIVKEEEKKSKAEAVKSIKFAEAAISKSLPLLAADTLKEAKKIKESGTKLNTDVLSKKKYDELTGLIKKSEDLNGKKEYWNSYLESKKAIAIGKEIIKFSIDLIPELREKLDTMKALNSELRENSFHKAADGELDSAGKILEDIDKYLKDEDLKSAFPALDKASELLDAAKEKIEKEEAEAKRRCEIKIASVEKLYEELVKEDKDRRFAEVLQKSKEILIEARNTLDEKKFDLSMQNAKDAELLLNSTSITIKNEYSKKKEIKDKNEEKISKDDSKDDSIEEGSVDEGNKIRFYTVEYRKRNKDCLWRIALKVYKNAKLWPLIYKANKDLIKDPDLIFPGQKFIIPPLPVKETKSLEGDGTEDMDSENIKNDSNKVNDEKINKEDEDFDDIENINKDMDKL